MASDQQVHVTSIASLPDSPMLPAPSLLIVGEVVRSAYIHADTFTATRNAALNLPLSPNYPSEHQTTLDLAR